jgi:protein gp37
MSETKIEWTAVRAPDGTWVPGYTFNPWWGCQRVSPACENCYAETWDARWGGDHWGQGAPFRFFSGMHWEQPRRWNAKAAKLGLRLRVFCGSMCDWLQDRPELEPHRARLLRLIDETPALDWLMLSKRPENLATLTPWAIRGGAPANVMLGTTVEDQKRADERIPVLLAFPSLRPAAMGQRFLSCEPLLGAIDLTGWGEAAARPVPDDMPSTWGDFVWPDWVPQRQRELVEEFWLPAWGRNPREWARDNYQQRTPATGARVGVVEGTHGIGWVCPVRSPLATFTGHYLHRWNNMGAVVRDDGMVYTVSSGYGVGWLTRWLQPDSSYAHRLSWVISSGESGHPSKVRETREEWHASLRDQCAAAGVAYFLKQTQDPNKPRGRVVSLPVLQGRQHRGQPGDAA